MGEVYRAYDPSLDRVVALKTIRPEVQDELLLGRFKREGRAAGRLRHPRIVTVYDLGEVDGTVFMAMEYLEGRSLAAEIRDGRLTFEARVRILLEVLDGLAYAHQNGVIHRDIKPANIQVLPDASVKILDFGVARLATSESLSQTGMVVGTVLYMAPEQLRGERVDGRADVYSAGVVGYELFAERRPFEGQSLTEIVLKVINEPPPPMHSRWLAGRPQLEEIVRHAIEKDPARRYPTAEAMASDLQGAVALAPPALATTAPSVAAAESSTVISRRSPPTTAPAATGTPAIPDAVTLAANDAAPTAMPSPAAPPSTTVPPLYASAHGPRVGLVRIAGACLLVLAVLVGLGALPRVLGGRWMPVFGSRAAVPDPVAPAAVPSPPVTASPAMASPPPVTDLIVVQPAPTPTVRSRSTSTVRGIAVSGDRQLAATVAGALRARGCPVVEPPAEAGLALRVAWSVGLRPAPFGTGVARTADYAGTAELSGAGGRTLRREFDGHVMEVGEAVTLAAARRSLAAQIADAIAGEVEACRP